MATTRTPVFDSIRILGKQDDFLDRKIGQRGEIYFDDLIGSLRVFNGQVGGITLLKDDLSNISTAALNKNVNFGTGTITATQFIGAGIGAVLGDVPPVAPVAQTGTLWFNTSTGKLYIYYNDGTSLQWVQPMTPSVGGGSGGGSGSGTVNNGLTGKLAYYPSNGTTVDDLAEVYWHTHDGASMLHIDGQLQVSAQKNYVRFHWETLSDLNTEAPPGTWHGMIAHVHETGRVYFAHSGVWTPLALQSDISGGVANILAGDNITISNSSGAYTINAVVGGGGGGISLEEAQDGAATLFSNGSHTGITFNYVDGSNALNAVVTDIPLGTRTTGNYVASITTTSGITGGTAGSESAVLTLGIDSSVVVLVTEAQTLTNKTINGSSNTITGIANASLTNSSITINGTTVSLGGTITVSSGGAVTTLDSLTDVVITSATDGQVLKYNGAIWVNGADAVGAGGSGNSFTTIAVAGQSSVAADSATDTLTFVAGTGITITTDSNADTVTITNNGAALNTFSTIAVTGQSNVVADSTTDTLTLTAGTGIQITTDANTDAVTITSTVSAGATTFSALTDNAGLTADQFYLPAITKLTVTANGSSAYLFDQYSGNNPTIYAIGGTTIAFDLGTSALSSHPFLIRFSGANYSTGLVHVSTTGTVTTGASAQGKTSGTLYWKIPASVSGTYGYLCQSHGTMIGSIIVKDITVI